MNRPWNSFNEDTRRQVTAFMRQKALHESLARCIDNEEFVVALLAAVHELERKQKNDE